MDPLRGMRALVRSIELGSLSAAARDLGTTQPTVSKLVAALEKSLGVRLLERSTTRLSPTEAGRRFHAHARQILDAYAEASASARGHAEQAAGLLRITAPLGFGELRLHAIVQRFLALHPAIEVELMLDDRHVDLVQAGVDLAVRLGGPLPPDAVARTLAGSPRVIVAAPDYLARHAPLRRIEDLDRHEFVRYAGLAGGARPTLDGPGGPRAVLLGGRYTVNSAMAIRESAREGRALALSPAWLVQDLLDEGALVRVLPRWQAEGHALRVVLPSRRYHPARTRIFIDHLAREVAGLPGLQPV
jgi:DNA-binding transcriptional LysR family regulator